MKVEEVISRVADSMDAKFERRFKFFCNSLDALAEARQRDLSDSFVLSGTGAKFSITFGFIVEGNERYSGTVLFDNRVCYRIPARGIT